MSDKTPLQDFYDRCASFDWYTDWSDDHSVWQRGNIAQGNLRAEADASPEHKALYDAWRAWAYTGEPWGNERAPKPERPS